MAAITRNTIQDPLDTPDHQRKRRAEQQTRCPREKSELEVNFFFRSMLFILRHASIDMLGHSNFFCTTIDDFGTLHFIVTPKSFSDAYFIAHLDHIRH